MPRIYGVFDYFQDLENASIDDVAVNLKVRPDIKDLENYIANRILYPQAASLTQAELELDLGILKQGLLKNKSYINLREKKILIPEVFYERFPDIVELCMAFIEVYKPQDMVTLVLTKSTGDEILGTYLWADFNKAKTLEINIEERIVKIVPGLNIVPCPKNRCHIVFKSQNGQLMGKNDLVFEVAGGNLGLIINGRQK